MDLPPVIRHIDETASSERAIRQMRELLRTAVEKSATVAAG